MITHYMFAQVNSHMKNMYVLHNKNKLHEESHCFTFLQIVVISSLIEDSWILTFAPAFSLL